MVPIAYACDPGTGSIVWHTMPGEKLEAMRSHPRVCVEVDRVDGPATWRSVVARGTVKSWRGRSGGPPSTAWSSG